MKKRIPIFFLVLLLAGILMGLVSSGAAQEPEAIVKKRIAWVQDDDGEPKVHLLRAFVGGGSGFLGIYPEEVTSETVQRLGLREERGALITKVVSDSAAARAGLQKDDVIVRWNNTPVESAIQLRRHLTETPGGRTVQLGIVRSGQEMEISVTLDKPKEFKWKVEKEAREALREGMDQAREALKNYDFGNVMVFGHRGRVGVTLQNLTPQLAEYFGLRDRSGTLITSVREDSPASRAGLKAGDILLAIDGEKVEDPGDAIRLIAKKDEGPVDLLILRDRREMNLTVTLEKSERTKHLFAPEIEAHFHQVPSPDIPKMPVAPTFERLAPPAPPARLSKPIPPGVI